MWRIVTAVLISLTFLAFGLLGEELRNLFEWPWQKFYYPSSGLSSPPVLAALIPSFPLNEGRFYDSCLPFCAAIWILLLLTFQIPPIVSPKSFSNGCLLICFVFALYFFMYAAILAAPFHVLLTGMNGKTRWENGTLLNHTFVLADALLWFVAGCLFARFILQVFKALRRPVKDMPLLILLGTLVTALSAFAEDAGTTTKTIPTVFHGISYFVHTVDPQKDDLQLFLNDDQGKPLLDFVALDKYVTSKGEHLLFAANAGMFEPTMKPVGLLVQDGKEISPLNLNDAAGNFYMKPNGVFLINEKHEARVIESSEYTSLLTPAVWATQSGPLLVHGGAIHPDFVPDSKNVAVRSGVGVRKNGTIVFAVSRLQVNFYDFAEFFRTRLDCPNALFLDGTISTFYAPGLKDTFPHRFGPMIGVVQQETKK